MFFFTDLAVFAAKLAFIAAHQMSNNVYYVKPIPLQCYTLRTYGYLTLHYRESNTVL